MPGFPWIFPNIIPWKEKTCWRKHSPDQDLTQVHKTNDRAMGVCGSQVLYDRCVSGELKHLPRSLNLQLQSCPELPHFTAYNTPQCLKLFHIISSVAHTICSLWGQPFYCTLLGTPHLSGDIWGRGGQHWRKKPKDFSEHSWASKHRLVSMTKSSSQSVLLRLSQAW